MSLPVALFQRQTRQDCIFRLSPLFLVISTLISAISVIGCAPTPVVDPITVAIAGKTATSVIQEADYSARNVVGEAERAGSAVMARGANQLEVLARDTEHQLDQDVSKHVQELSEENRKLLYELEKTRQSVEKLSPDAYRLKDATVLDLKDLTGDTWFAKKHSYWVQRVDGLSQTLSPTGAEYQISILGIGFGPDADDRRSHIHQILIDGKPIKVREDTPATYQTILNLPNDAMRPLFDDHKMRIVRLEIDEAVSEKGALGHWSRDELHHLSLWLSLMPRFGGTVTITYSVPFKDWVTVGDSPFEHAYAAPNCHRDNTKDPTHPISDSYTLPDPDERFVGATNWKRVNGPGCPWMHDEAVTIGNGGRTLNFGATCDGSGCNYSYSAYIQKFQPIREDKKTMTRDLTFGEFLVLELPKDTTFWTINGRTSTLQHIDVVAGQSSAWMEQRDDKTSELIRRIVYFVPEPK